MILGVQMLVRCIITFWRNGCVILKKTSRQSQGLFQQNIALGQTYFAIQTYRQEVADHFNELDEDNRRLVVRGDIKQWNQMLAETAHNAGVITNEEFAIFQNAGYMGLYGGLDVDDIHTKKQLEVGQKILDYMGSTELIASLFRISQTEEKLRKDKIVGAETATSVAL